MPDLFKLIYKVFNGGTFKHSEWINNISLMTGSSLGLLWGWAISKPAPSVVQKTGRVITKKLKEISQDIKQEGKPEGIEIAPGLKVSLAREKQHFFILGETGAGKSQIMMPWVKQAIGRGDRVMLYDFKGSVALKLNPEKIYLFAPWFKNSVGCDIGKDILNTQDARTFAASIIKMDTKNTFFCNSARDLLSGFIMALQAQNGQAWGFADLAKLIKLGTTAQYELLNQYSPIAAQHLAGGDDSTTVNNVRSNLIAAVSDLLYLGDAWNDCEKISIKNFLMGNPEKKIIVLQGNLDYDTLTNAYVSAIISVVSRSLGNPNFKEIDNRIWLFLDEFQELGRINGLETILAVARGKGIRVVLASQDFGRCIENYGANVWHSIFANVSTKVIGKITATEATDTIGDTTSERRTLSTSSGGNGQSQSLGIQIEKGRAIETYMLGEELGKFERGLFKKVTGFKAYIFMGGSKIGLGVWPLTAFDDVAVHQEAADWTVPGFISVLSNQNEGGKGVEQLNINKSTVNELKKPTITKIYNIEDDGIDEYDFDAFDALSAIHAADADGDSE